MITIKEFCRRTGLSSKTVRNYIAAGKLKYQQRKKGATIFVDYEEYFQTNIEDKTTFNKPEDTYEYIKKHLKKTIDEQIRHGDDKQAIVKNLNVLHKIEMFLLANGYYTDEENSGSKRKDQK
jgi:hypothetical protein